MIREFLEKGGSISKGKTKPMPNELRISNNAWNTKLTKEEKAAQEAAKAAAKADLQKK
ncbi:hypothetical protein [Pacificibacter sp.]|uniref:hypothetical protein n=1 Tax=Pacificibacter sp. TaxID=1917866 RepID=UPI00321AFED2